MFDECLALRGVAGFAFPYRLGSPARVAQLFAAISSRATLASNFGTQMSIGAGS